MKIAIKANPSRGEEIISLLKSLGGINKKDWKGDGRVDTYYIDKDNNIQYDRAPKDYKVYTLEEFEKEFPFKVGDKVRHISSIGTIRKYCYIDNKPGYEVESMELGIIANIPAEILEPYKEMKEERNIKLTLDKAKEWYSKGGELREIALQAFTREELNPLPKSWEEFCRKHKSVCLSTRYANMPLKYDALIKLEQLRNCWWNGWEPEWNNCEKYVIKWDNNDLIIFTARNIRAFLVFPTREMAYEFLNCFRDLIEKAGDLI